MTQINHHSIPVFKPRIVSNKLHQGDKKLLIKWPIPKSVLSAFHNWVCTHSWEELSSEMDINHVTNKFMSIVQTKIDEFFPTKTQKIPKNNKP